MKVSAFLQYRYSQTRLERTARKRPNLFVITGVRYNRVITEFHGIIIEYFNLSRGNALLIT